MHYIFQPKDIFLCPLFPLNICYFPCLDYFSLDFFKELDYFCFLKEYLLKFHLKFDFLMKYNKFFYIDQQLSEAQLPFLIIYLQIVLDFLHA